jgi:tetratricopeptide (TPR) repeat protein
MNPRALSLFLALALSAPAAASAQVPDDAGVDLEEEALPGEPVTAGPMTDEALRGKRLFDAMRWTDAALVLNRVVDGDTGDDLGNRQIAKYHLAIALYRLGFPHSSYSFFSEIADEPTHARYDETLLWLAKLVGELPEPAEIVERIGKYDKKHLDRFDNPQQRELYWRLNYLLGRFKYRNGAHDEAIALFDKVAAPSEHYLEAQFFLGISHVRRRGTVPAVKAFRRMIPATAKADPEQARMRDLGAMSIARTYYSAAVNLGDSGGPTLDQRKLEAAVQSWSLVDVGSEYWLDSLFEQSWAYFMLGDYSRALGNLHTVEAPFFPDAFYPEAHVLRAVIYFVNCNYPEAVTLIARMRLKYQPIKRELEATLARWRRESDDAQLFQTLEDVRAKRARLPPIIRPVIEKALEGRQLLRHVQYVSALDEERARLARAPAALRDSALGGEALDALDLARDLAIRTAGALARERCERALRDLHEHIVDSQKLLFDVNQAVGGSPARGAPARGGREVEVPLKSSIEPDRDHVLWPFDGEYWRDELGSYRGVVVNRCPK